MKKNIKVSEDKFIVGSDLIKDGKKLFQDNGIHANKYYHKLIADRIVCKLADKIEKIAASKQDNKQKKAQLQKSADASYFRSDLKFNRPYQEKKYLPLVY